MDLLRHLVAVGVDLLGSRVRDRRWGRGAPAPGAARCIPRSRAGTSRPPWRPCRRRRRGRCGREIRSGERGLSFTHAPTWGGRGSRHQMASLTPPRVSCVRHGGEVGRGRPPDRSAWYEVLGEALGEDAGFHWVRFYQEPGGWRFDLECRTASGTEERILERADESVALNVYTLLVENGMPLDPDWRPSAPPIPPRGDGRGSSHLQAAAAGASPPARRCPPRPRRPSNLDRRRPSPAPAPPVDRARPSIAAAEPARWPQPATRPAPLTAAPAPRQPRPKARAPPVVVVAVAIAARELRRLRSPSANQGGVCRRHPGAGGSGA